MLVLVMAGSACRDELPSIPSAPAASKPAEEAGLKPVQMLPKPKTAHGGRVQEIPGYAGQVECVARNNNGQTTLEVHFQDPKGQPLPQVSDVVFAVPGANGPEEFSGQTCPPGEACWSAKAAVSDNGSGAWIVRFRVGQERHRVAVPIRSLNPTTLPEKKP